MLYTVISSIPELFRWSDGQGAANLSRRVTYRISIAVGNLPVPIPAATICYQAGNWSSQMNRNPFRRKHCGCN
jgi:hypothetical protein